jgi:hypothetical protein
MFVKGLFDNLLGSGIVCLLAQLSVLLCPDQVDCGLPSGLIWTKGDILLERKHDDLWYNKSVSKMVL